MSLQLATLPNSSIQHLDRLPDCPAIYFAIDERGRVLYIGQAKNLANRWRGKGHHRIEQLRRIHRRHPVTLAWLDCTDCCDAPPKRLHQRLKELEDQYIEEFQPLLNGTEVPAAKVIPAETVLQQSLEKIAKYVVAFGLVETPETEPPTVILKYSGYGRQKVYLRRIIQGINRQPSTFRWTEFVRSKFSPWWRAKCNGVDLQLGPWFETKYDPAPVTEAVSHNKNLHPLAGTMIPTLSPKVLEHLLQSDPNLAKNYPGLKPYCADPISLIWQDFATKR
ncbi:GIY-YIG nuclease family protein [Oscillatoria sp. CS-180]|uniref:GIY-YIG nuclease family protein n=1 Tax=Oscillatoria sp. CS-180 TaxID=3021720 RepID=UPI00232E0401|nr:GIY-YIG nuclease family protein [Oscillatoria sp. CS-180]